MKIVKLKAENIKKLVAVEIAPNGNLVKITGKNASGKTSVLDSIWWCLGGSQNIQEEPIRKGEKKASIECDLGEMVVKRTFNEGGTTALTIENKDGLRFKSPQTMLDGLLGKLSFDPLEFMRQEPRKQFETLRTLTGVDFSKLDGMRQKLYDERTLLNRDVKRLEVQVEGVMIPKEPEPVDATEIDVSKLVGRVSEAVNAQEEVGELRARHAEVCRQIIQSEQTYESLKKQIEEHQRVLERHDKLSMDLSVEASDLEKAMAQAPVFDLPTLQTELKSAEETNKSIRIAVTSYLARKGEIEQAKVIKAKLRAELESTELKAADLTVKIETVDEEKQQMIGAAQFPLDGLGFGNGAVMYRELPLAQASSAEQLRVSMAMAMSLNPKLKVIRITDGSLLDTSSMKIVEEMANGNDYQVWVEVVDESGKVGIVIEDGQVAAVNE